MFFMTAALTNSSPGLNQVFLTMLTTAITVFNPLTTMFFMGSYRAVILQKLGKRSKIQPLETQVTGLSLATHQTSTANTPSTATG
ncbi:hypothetical protein AAVH_33659 [Aphelenchoides avenae]|nr:hypothetical protein AAVH_33659 [Aphelenchus avenae]